MIYRPISFKAIRKKPISSKLYILGTNVLLKNDIALVRKCYIVKTCYDCMKSFTKNQEPCVWNATRGSCYGKTHAIKNDIDFVEDCLKGTIHIKYYGLHCCYDNQITLHL